MFGGGKIILGGWEIQLLEHGIPALLVRHENPDGDISEIKRAMRDLLVTKGPDFRCRFKFLELF